jgi:hypothetical protein
VETGAGWLSGYRARSGVHTGRGPACHRLGVQPAGAVGGPDQRPGHHAREAEAECLFAEPVEFGGSTHRATGW